MKIPTRSSTSTYDLTIDWTEPKLSFSQSPLRHIPSMNVGSHGINQVIKNQGNPKFKSLPPSSYHNLTKTSQEIANQNKLGWLIIFSPYLEELSCLHPPIKGFPKKTISTANPLEFSWDHLTWFQHFLAIQSSTKKWMPWHNSYLGNGKARLKPLSNPTKPMPMTTNEPNTQMHKPCIHTSSRKPHMQPVTYKNVLLKLLIQPSPFFPCLSLLSPFPSFACFISFSSWCSSLSLKLIPNPNWQKTISWSLEALSSLRPLLS